MSHEEKRGGAVFPQAGSTLIPRLGRVSRASPTLLLERMAWEGLSEITQTPASPPVLAHVLSQLWVILSCNNHYPSQQFYFSIIPYSFLSCSSIVREKLPFSPVYSCLDSMRSHPWKCLVSEILQISDFFPTSPPILKYLYLLSDHEIHLRFIYI